MFPSRQFRVFPRNHLALALEVAWENGHLSYVWDAGCLRTIGRSMGWLLLPLTWTALSFLPHMGGRFFPIIELRGHLAAAAPLHNPLPGVHLQHITILLASYSSSLCRILLFSCFLIFYLSPPSQYKLYNSRDLIYFFSTDISPNTRKCCRCLAHSRLSINIFE